MNLNYTQPSWKKFRDQGIVSAKQLLNELGYNKTPIDVFGIADILGVEVRYAYNRSWSGVLQTDVSPPKARIWIDASEESERVRFTMAHELGHLFLDPLGVTYRYTGGAIVTESDRAANLFALDLLMPEHFVVAYASMFGRDPGVLSSVFQVSPGVMSWRLKSLGM